MSHRDRPEPSGGAPAAAAPVPAAAAAARPPRAPDAAWDALFDALPPDRRHDLLALAAARGGCLPADRVPPPPAPDAARPLLPRLLAGEVELPPPPAYAGDLPPDLDAQQREAVAAALRTPDVCLIQGLPGTGKSCVAAEILARAAGRGERVLLLAPGPAALDRALELLADRPEVCAVRLLGRDESEAALPPAAAR